MKIINNKIITNEGKILTNGETYAHHLRLGIYNSPSNQQKINEEEAPKNE